VPAFKENHYFQKMEHSSMYIQEEQNTHSVLESPVH